MSDIVVKRGTAVRRSVRGTKNFFYPDMDGKCMMIREDSPASFQPGWRPYGEWFPIIVSAVALSKKDRYPGDKPKMVVWVRRNDG